MNYYLSKIISFFSTFPGDCGGEHTETKGFITSPGFPDKYPNGKECMHSIIVPNEKVVKLVFKRSVVFINSLKGGCPMRHSD
jgi:hypothetical protein